MTFCLFKGYPNDWNSAKIDFDVEDSSFQTIDTTTEIVGSMQYDDRADTGHRLENMLLKCTFQKKHCSPG